MKILIGANRFFRRISAIGMAFSLGVTPSYSAAIDASFCNPKPQKTASLFWKEAICPAPLRWEHRSFAAKRSQWAAYALLHLATGGLLLGGLGPINANNNHIWRSFDVRLPAVTESGSPARTLHVRVEEGLPHKDSPLIPFTQALEFRVNGRKMSGDFYWMRGKAYLRLGNRWVRLQMEVPDPHVFDFLRVPFADLLQGELVMGNPSLQELLDVKPAMGFLADQRKMPVAFENIVEMKDVLGKTEYNAGQIAEAAEFLENNTLGPSDLTLEILMRYLDALLILAHPDAGHEDLFVDALDRFQYFLKTFETSASKQSDLGSLTTDFFAKKAKEVAVLAQKRKLGFDQISMDFLALPEMAARIKTLIDNRGTVWAGGRIAERHFFNETRWIPDVRKASEIAEYATRLDANLNDYGSESDVGFAGNATRVFKNILANKNTVRIIQVEDSAVEVLQSWMNQQTESPWKPEMIRIGDHWYVSLMDLVGPRNPNALLIAGPSSLRDAKNSARNSFETQPLAHPIHEKTGQFIESEADLAGHGDLIQLLLRSVQRLTGTLLNGRSYRHVQSDDLGNKATGRVLAWLTQTGQAVMAATVTPQRIDFVAQVRQAQAALNQGKKVQIHFAGEDPMVVKSIDAKVGTLTYIDQDENEGHYPYEKVRVDFAEKFDDLIDGVSPLLKQAADPANVARQRDLLFEAMRRFQENIYAPFPKVELVVEGAEENVPLLKIDMNEGGNVLEMDGDVVFVEHSQFAADSGSRPGVVLSNSRGQSHAFNHNVVLAIFFRHFNTNNFGLDPLALAGNYDPAIKKVYFDFLNFTHARPWGRESQEGQFRTQQEILAARRAAEKEAARIMSKLTDQQWAERSIVLDLLMSTLLPPPVEKKGGKIKVNKMAQNKASFLAHLALTDVTAKDFDFTEFDRAIKSGVNLNKRSGAPISLAMSEHLSAETQAQIKAVQGVEVPKTEFTQAKFIKDYNTLVIIANAVFAAEETIGVAPFSVQSFDQMRAIAAIQFAGRARRAGAIIDKVFEDFNAAMIRIHSGQNTEFDIELLKWFRSVVYEARWGELTRWGRAELREAA